MPDRSSEIRALSRLAFSELAAFTGGIGEIHSAIATRAFGAAGPGGGPARLTHDAIAGGVYAGLRGAAGLASRAADAALALRPVAEEPRISVSPRGALALGALNGLIGDQLELEGSELAQAMSVRAHGEPVAPQADALRRAFAGATPRLVVFLHGLMETDFAWRLRERQHGGAYGDRLRAELGCTPVYVRYNTGRHISENGRSLAELMEDLTRAWPVEVEEIALVGHSMGGLVARSACHLAAENGHAWVPRVGHLISLGTPHMGAPLAQGVHYASAALGRMPETRALSAFLRRRSSGIRDLRHGSLVDEDWRDTDPETLRAKACTEVPLLEGATHCFVSATVTRGGRDPVGRLVGDTLVLVPSATGRSRTRRLPFRAEHGLHVGGTHHIALLNHPAVYERLRDWLRHA